jgi:D-arginine utilization repressor
MATAKVSLTASETALVNAIVTLLHPSAEVVLHDFRRDRIAAIWNPISGRKVGDPALLGQLPDHSEVDAVVGPYEKIGPNGHRITSVSIYVADRTGLICINLDRHPLDQAIRALSSFAAAIVPRPQELFEHDWREEMASVVDDDIRSAENTLTALSG